MLPQRLPPSTEKKEGRAARLGNDDDREDAYAMHYARSNPQEG